MQRLLSEQSHHAASCHIFWPYRRNEKKKILCKTRSHLHMNSLIETILLSTCSFHASCVSCVAQHHEEFLNHEEVLPVSENTHFSHLHGSSFCGNSQWKPDRSLLFFWIDTSVCLLLFFWLPTRPLGQLVPDLIVSLIPAPACCWNEFRTAVLWEFWSDKDRLTLDLIQVVSVVFEEIPVCFPARVGALRQPLSVRSCTAPLTDKKEVLKMRKDLNERKVLAFG